MLVLNRNEFLNRTGECVKKAKNCRLRPTTATDDKIMSNFAKCILFNVLRHLNTEFNANNISDCGIIFLKNMFQLYVDVGCVEDFDGERKKCCDCCVSKEHQHTKMC